MSSGSDWKTDQDCDRRGDPPRSLTVGRIEQLTNTGFTPSTLPNRSGLERQQAPRRCRRCNGSGIVVGPGEYTTDTCPECVRGVVQCTEYLIGCIDTQTGEFQGFDFFSEPSPTTHLQIYLWVALEGKGASPEAARETLRAKLDTPGYQWMKPYLRSRSTAAPAERVPLLHKALLQKAVALLDDAEWAGTIWTDTSVCPWCRGISPDSNESGPLGHETDCTYAAFKREVAP